MFNRKLTDEQVQHIRVLCTPDGTYVTPYSQIAAQFGVNGSTVGKIARGEIRKTAAGPIEGVDYPKQARPNAIQARAARGY